MPGLTVPGSTPPRRPPARPPQTGSYQQTAGGSTYLPSPEEQAEAARQAALRRQAEDDAWTANERRAADERANRDYADENQRYADRRSDRREGINALAGLTASFGGSGGGSGGSGGGGGTSGTSGTGAYNPAADAATYTRAKENTGQALTAAQRGLDEAMNRRGIFGSGIHAGNLQELYESGLGDLAETDRQLAEGTADRGFRSSEAAAGRNWESGERERDRAAGFATSRLQALLNLYGMVY
jgi:hypothetical protein